MRGDFCRDHHIFIPRSAYGVLVVHTGGCFNRGGDMVSPLLLTGRYLYEGVYFENAQIYFPASFKTEDKVIFPDSVSYVVQTVQQGA